MNKIEKEILKNAKKLIFHVLTQEIEKQKNAAETETDKQFFVDVLNSGIILDVQKLKLHGLKFLEYQIKKQQQRPAAAPPEI